MKPAAQIRIELLAALSRLGQLRPEWRLCQTLANLAMTVWPRDQDICPDTLYEDSTKVPSWNAEPQADGPEQRPRSLTTVG
jgi:hypothetical protein